MYSNSLGKQTIVMNCSEKDKCMDFFYCWTKGALSIPLKETVMHAKKDTVTTTTMVNTCPFQ